MSIESRSCQYGKVFDHWQIREFLGQGSGGKSAVFRLVHSDSEMVHSALKVINLIEERGNYNKLPDFRKNEYEHIRKISRENAEREVFLMNSFQGRTNVVDYLDHTFVDWADEKGFGCDMLIRMELLKDLRGEVQNGRQFCESEVLKIGRDICSALVLCHSKNILHRDIKPENIFFNRDGNYKLGDFGVARILSAAPMSMASTGIGTPQYWAPEQTSGNYDKRVDIYSLGLVLYELSNNNLLPFATSSYVTEVEVQQRMMGMPFPNPRNASSSLAGILLKACAYRAEDRYQTAQEFLDALNRLSGSTYSGAVHQPLAETQKAEPRRQGKAEGKLNRETGYATVPAASASDTEAFSEQSKEKRKRMLPAVCLAAMVCLTLLLCWRLIPREETEPEDTGEVASSAASDPVAATTPVQNPIVEAPAQTQVETPEETAAPPLTMSQLGDATGLNALTFSGASASTELDDPTYGRFPAQNAIDGNTKTSWQEGEVGYGIGESITLVFREETEVSALKIYPGYAESETAFYLNGRPSSLRFEFSDGTSCICSFEDTLRYYLLALSRPVTTEYIRITILGSYEARWQDTAISEVVAYK